MPATSLRRSRRSTPKRTSDYSVGDIVEIVRHGVPLNGRLVYLLSEGQTPNPRWLVTFDNESQKDEELYEKAFGKLIFKSSDGEDSKPRPRVRPVLNKPTSKPSGTTAPASESEEKAVTFSTTNTPAQSDDSSSGGRDQSLSARERRSQRRQAKIDDDPPPLDLVTSMNPTTTTTSNKRQRNRDRNRDRNRSSSKNGSRKRHKSVDVNEDEVVKVKLLTGTLYLYRGLHRRAEFVRRF